VGIVVHQAVSKVIAASIYSVICFIMWHYTTIYSGIISIF
jgi:hypothetical protein